MEKGGDSDRLSWVIMSKLTLIYSYITRKVFMYCNCAQYVSCLDEAEAKGCWLVEISPNSNVTSSQHDACRLFVRLPYQLVSIFSRVEKESKQGMSASKTARNVSRCLSDDKQKEKEKKNSV